MKRGGPLPRKRDRPRRNEGRVQHARIKDKQGRAPNAEELLHHKAVRKMPCIGCGFPGPSTLHHVRHKITRSGTHDRDHKRVVPLCPACHFHDHGSFSVERIHEQGFYERTGIDLWAEAERLWAQRSLPT